MLKRKPCIIITFDTTADAIGMEVFCREKHLPGRLSELPAALHAGCGLCWKAPAQAEEEIIGAIEEEDLEWNEYYEMDL
ncbi:hypothetical protein P261_00992 [Lachnospiraceae bacterium TWA4]|nr:hypothetical protein P261_00992 [Lachnospiraceae bacterium TWA4]